MKRTILPIVVIPLDEFGEATAKNFQEEISLAEPQLLQYEWLKVLPVWESAAQTEIVRTISVSLLLNTTSEDTPFQSAIPGGSFVYVVLIGSLTINPEVISESLESLQAEFLEEGLVESLRYLTILDISQIPGEKQKTETSELSQLEKTLAEIKWPDYVYLVQNKSASGLRATSRDEISEAIRLYIEGVVLGDHWHDFPNSWLNRRVTGPARFASFSVFSMASPQSELLKYFSHVNFYELIESASKVSDFDIDLPELGKANVDDPALGPSKGVEETHSSSSSHVNSHRMELRPKVFEPKSSFWQRVTTAIDEFKMDYIHQFNQEKEELPAKGKALRAASENQLDQYSRKLNELILSVIAEEKFSFGMDKLADKMLYHAERIEFIDEIFDVDLPEMIDLDVQFKPHLDALREKVKRLPNASSLITIAFFVLILQILFTMQLLDFWDINSNLRLIIFWCGLALWLTGGIYFAWRLPSWTIKQFIREHFINVARTLTSRIKNAIKNLHTSLARHLHRKPGQLKNQ